MNKKDGGGWTPPKAIAYVLTPELLAGAPELRKAA
jgi:hypothetical protein